MLQRQLWNLYNSKFTEITSVQSVHVFNETTTHTLNRSVTSAFDDVIIRESNDRSRLLLSQWTDMLHLCKMISIIDNTEIHNWCFSRVIFNFPFFFSRKRERENVSPSLSHKLSITENKYAYWLTSLALENIIVSPFFFLHIFAFSLTSCQSVHSYIRYTHGIFRASNVYICLCLCRRA